ncbi:hypothetical protein ACJ7V3_07850 [Halomonas elongata]|uniref:hypothetical protein n=1 Tax=Halomonas elongata TaxID=2746 RepID=UPI0038D37D48
MSNDNLTTDEMGDVENISFGDILNGLKTAANALRLPGEPKIPYTSDASDLSGDTTSVDHWGGLDNALQTLGVHAEALLDDWDSQQENIAQHFEENPVDEAGADQRALQAGLQMILEACKRK